MLLENKNAVIYGGGGAIGGAVARAFAREGATVHLAGRTLATVERVAEEIRATGGAASAVQLDALDEAAVDEHADTMDGIDISINVIAHGDVQGTPLAEMRLADFERPVHNAVRTTFLTARAAARHMIKQGSGVILMFGGYGDPAANVGGLQVAFGALDSLRRSLARELGSHGIRVVTLQTAGVPDSIPTNFVHGAAITRQIVDKTMLGRAAMPDGAGVIVRTAAEGATEEELSRDVARLAAQWEAVEPKSREDGQRAGPPVQRARPDHPRGPGHLQRALRVKLVVAGDEGWDLVHEYVQYVAPHLAERLTHWTDDDEDVFARYRIDEQLAKALERKVWLPSERTPGHRQHRGHDGGQRGQHAAFGLSGRGMRFVPSFIGWLFDNVPSFQSQYGVIRHARCGEASYANVPVAAPHIRWTISPTRAGFSDFRAALSRHGPGLRNQRRAPDGTLDASAWVYYEGREYRLNSMIDSFFRLHIDRAGDVQAGARMFSASVRGPGWKLEIQAEAPLDEFARLEADRNTEINTTLFGTCRATVGAADSRSWRNGHACSK